MPKISADGASGGGQLAVPADAFIREDGVVTAPPAASGALLAANNLSDLDSAGTALSNLGALPKAGGTMTGALAPAVVALTFASSIAVNAASGNDFRVTLTASTGTVAAPSNPVDGQVIKFQITQGTGGSFTLAWNAAFNFGTAGAPTLSTAAGDVDIAGFVYNAALSEWCYLGSSLGL
jgi:hypothetical protein